MKITLIVTIILLSGGRADISGPATSMEQCHTAGAEVTTKVREVMAEKIDTVDYACVVER